MYINICIYKYIYIYVYICIYIYIPCHYFTASSATVAVKATRPRRTPMWTAGLERDTRALDQSEVQVADSRNTSRFTAQLVRYWQWLKVIKDPLWESLGKSREAGTPESSMETGSMRPPRCSTCVLHEELWRRQRCILRLCISSGEVATNWTPKGSQRRPKDRKGSKNDVKVTQRRSKEANRSQRMPKDLKGDQIIPKDPKASPRRPKESKGGQRIAKEANGMPKSLKGGHRRLKDAKDKKGFQRIPKEAKGGQMRPKEAKVDQRIPKETKGVYICIHPTPCEHVLPMCIVFFILWFYCDLCMFMS